MRIEIDGSVIRIFEIEIEDALAAGMLAQEPDERAMADAMAAMLELGARVLQQQREGEQGQIVRMEIERLREQVDQAMEAGGAQFVEAMRPVLEQVAQQIASIGGRLDGVLAVAQKERELEMERERGTAKGRPFEAEVAEYVDHIARVQGDSCEHVGDAWGVAGRAGDAVVGIGAASGAVLGRVVFEVKTGRLSRPEAMRELDRALVDRGADYAVLVVAGAEKLPAGTFELREYGGDKLIVSFDEIGGNHGIELAYSLARARVLSRASAAADVDIDGAKAAIEQAVQQLDQIRSIKLKMTSIAAASEQATGMVDDMARTIKLNLARATAALE